MRKVVMCAMAGVLAGCSLIPDMDTPPPPVARAWPEGPAYAAPAADAKPFADLGWNRVFQSPDLRRLIDAALAENRDLRVAALDVEAARATYRIARADLFPEVDGGASGTRARTPADLSSAGRAITGGTYSANLGSTAFELDFFGRVRSLEAEALERFLATEEARANAQIALVAEVAQAWLTWQADRAQLRLAEETLATRAQSLDLVTARFRNGVATQLDVAQARASLETARVARVSYVRAVAQDRNAIELLVGRPLAEAELADAEIGGAVALPPVGTSSDVLLRRPDIREAEHALRAANADIGAARAAFFPTISLTGSLGVSSASLGNLFEGGARTWSFGPNLSVPIFTAGRTQANLDAAKIARESAVATYEKTIQTAFREVADALAARATLVDEIVAQGDLVAADREALELAQRRYTRGVADYLDVLDAQRELFAAQQSEIALRLQEASNLVSLYKALGGGVAAGGE